MKRHNLLPLATVVALCMSVTSTTVPLGALNVGAQTVYAGVVNDIRRNYRRIFGCEHH